MRKHLKSMGRTKAETAERLCPKKRLCVHAAVSENQGIACPLRLRLNIRLKLSLSIFVIASFDSKPYTCISALNNVRSV